MRISRPPFRALILTALLALTGALAGFSVAAPDRREEAASGKKAAAEGPHLALGDRQAISARSARGGLAAGRATGNRRSEFPRGNGRSEPESGLAAIVPAAPGPLGAADPEPVAAAAPTPSTPGATAEAPVALAPVTSPAPGAEAESGSGRPPKSTAAVDPGLPLEPKPSPSPGSLVLGIDGGYAGWTVAEVRDRTELGAAVTRHEWDISNPTDSEEPQVLAAATEIHTRIQALIGGNQLGDATHYSDWVVGFIRYYGPGGTFWLDHPELDASRYAITTIELGNEPYLGEMSAADYADTVRPTLERVRDLGLPVRVVLPAYVYGDDTSWIDTLYEHIPNLNSLFYAFAFHPYWYGHDPATPGDSGPFTRIETLRQRIDELGAGSKPIFLTEYGESTASCGEECVSEAAQAEHLKEMIDAVASHADWKVEMLSLFQLIDRGTGSADRELQFGLLREDGTPKPSYAIVRAAMQQYR